MNQCSRSVFHHRVDLFPIFKTATYIIFAGGAVFGSNVVNVESWRSVATLRGHEGDILDVAWSPGDVWLASASIDNNVIIWNTAKWPGELSRLLVQSLSLPLC